MNSKYKTKTMDKVGLTVQTRRYILRPYWGFQIGCPIPCVYTHIMRSLVSVSVHFLLEFHFTHAHACASSLLGLCIFRLYICLRTYAWRYTCSMSAKKWWLLARTFHLTGILPSSVVLWCAQLVMGNRLCWLHWWKDRNTGLKGTPQDEYSSATLIHNHLSHNSPGFKCQTLTCWQKYC